MKKPSKSHSMFAAAICRGLSEGGDGCEYFGSLGGWQYYKEYAMKLGWLDKNGKLTEEGMKIGTACQTIPKNRAYFFHREYVNAIVGVLGRINWE